MNMSVLQKAVPGVVALVMAVTLYACSDGTETPEAGGKDVVQQAQKTPRQIFYL